VQDAQAKLHNMGVEVVGISPDSTVVQRKVSDKLNLKFSLLSDNDHSVADTYGVWDKDKGIIRSTFFIDEDGMILAVWYKVCRKHLPRGSDGCPRYCKRWLSSVDDSEHNFY
jgi:thioredoxin-dependent peroxiredoxin